MLSVVVKIFSTPTIVLIVLAIDCFVIPILLSDSVASRSVLFLISSASLTPVLPICHRIVDRETSHPMIHRISSSTSRDSARLFMPAAGCIPIPVLPPSAIFSPGTNILVRCGHNYVPFVTILKDHPSHQSPRGLLIHLDPSPRRWQLSPVHRSRPGIRTWP